MCRDTKVGIVTPCRTQPKQEAKKIQPNSKPLLLHIVTMDPSRFLGIGTACTEGVCI